MKNFVTFLTLTLGILTLNASDMSYVYVEEGTFSSIDGGKVYQGTPVTIHTVEGDKAEVSVSGFMNPDDTHTIYATKNLKVILVVMDEASKIVVDGDKATVKLSLDKSMLEADVEVVWEDRADMFYETCTQCHAAPVIPHHTMIEWDGLYGSMKEFAKPTKEQTETILRFLWVHAKDGIIKVDGH